MLAQKLILSYSTRIFVHILQMLVGVIVARIAGPNIIGAVAFGLSYVSIFSFIADLGLSTAHIKKITEGESEGDCISTFKYLKFTLIILYSLVVFSIWFIQRIILKYEFESPKYDLIILISLFTVILSEFYKIPQTTFFARVEQAKSDLPEIVNNILHQAFRLIVALLNFKAIALAISRLIASILVLPFYLFLFRKYPRGKFNKKLAKEYFSISIPMFFIILTNSIISFSDKIILQFFSNSAEVGYYVAAFNFTNFITLIQNSVGTIFFPTLSRLINEKNFNGVNNIIKKYEQFNFIFILPQIIILSVCSDLIITLILGNQYKSSIPLLSIIIFAVFIPLINLPYGNILLAMNLFKLSANIFFTNMIFFVIIATLLVFPSLFNLKGLGIAIAILMSNILMGFLFIYFTHSKNKEIKILPSINIFIFGIFIFVIFYIIYKSFLLQNWLKILSIPIFYLIFYSGILLLKMTNKDTIIYFLKEIINIKKLKVYIKKEINS